MLEGRLSKAIDSLKALLSPTKISLRWRAWREDLAYRDDWAEYYAPLADSRGRYALDPGGFAEYRRRKRSPCVACGHSELLHDRLRDGCTGSPAACQACGCGEVVFPHPNCRCGATDGGLRADISDVPDHKKSGAARLGPADLDSQPLFGPAGFCDCGKFRDHEPPCCVPVEEGS